MPSKIDFLFGWIASSISLLVHQTRDPESQYSVRYEQPRLGKKVEFLGFKYCTEY